SGIEGLVKAAVKKGTPLIGICGGYQMLGIKILDPYGVESALKEVDGMGVLNTVTTLDRTKTTCQVEAELTTEKLGGLEDERLSLNKDSINSTSQLLNFKSSFKLRGYEIHMGFTTGDVGLFKLRRLQSPELSGTGQSTEHRACLPDRQAQTTDKNNLGSGFRVLGSEVLDGSSRGHVWGTYLHGLFDNDEFRSQLLASLRQRKGSPAIGETVNYSRLREDAINRWAGILKNNIDICFILRQIGMEHCKEELIRSRS
ncbi:MAG TPA: hypothetical protein ENH40_01575, partial [Nitrospirae bacterium]|nr:hypothetical protein [Nitrospirota bacterium]